MSQNYRLDKIGLINRGKKISFKFNGKNYFGYEGDTLASALIANGVHLVGRSFKYHRPRGFFGAGVDEPYAMVQLIRDNESIPNVRATEQELFEGLEAKSVNCWPNVTVKNRSQVFGYYDHNMLVMSERISDHLPKTNKYIPKQRLWYIRAKEIGRASCRERV